MGLKKENYQRIRNLFTKLLGSKCVHCGSKDELEFDHIIPSKIMMHDMSRSKREWHWFDEFMRKNLQLLCKKCNMIKTDSYPIYFVSTSAIL